MVDPDLNSTSVSRAATSSATSGDRVPRALGKACIVASQGDRDQAPTAPRLEPKPPRGQGTSAPRGQGTSTPRRSARRAAAGTTPPGPGRRCPPRSPRRGRTLARPRRGCSPRGQSAVSSSRSGNAPIRCHGSTWARPNDRMPGRVDDPALLGLREPQHDRRGGGVPAPAGDDVDVPDLAVGVRHQRVDQRGLAHPAVADEHADPSRELVLELGQVAALAGHHPRHSQRAVGGEQCLGVGEVGLRQAQQRPHPGVVRRHQGAVDQPGPRLGVGERGDDDQLVGVGDEHPLDRVVVVGGAAQHGRTFVHLDDPGQRALGAGHVADDRGPGRRRRRPCGRAAGPSPPAR